MNEQDKNNNTNNITYAFLKAKDPVLALCKELDIPQEEDIYNAIAIFYDLWLMEEPDSPYNYKEIKQDIEDRIKWFEYHSQDFPMEPEQEKSAFIASLLSVYAYEETKPYQNTLSQEVTDILNVIQEPDYYLHKLSDFNNKPAMQFTLGLCLLERFRLLKSSYEPLPKAEETLALNKLKQHTTDIVNDTPRPTTNLSLACQANAKQLKNMLTQKTQKPKAQIHILPR